MLVQSVAKATASANGLAAISSWKQGPMRQGGPADTMLRRFVVPETFDPAVDNPYAFANMECETFLIEPATNPYYPGGVCADPAINLSGVVPDTCIDDGDGGASIACPTVDFDRLDLRHRRHQPDPAGLHPGRRQYPAGAHLAPVPIGWHSAGF